MASVTLDVLVQGLQRRGSPLAPESALFVVLECAEVLAHGPRRLTLTDVHLDAEGNAELSHCESCSESDAIFSLAAVLRRLCDSLTPTALEFASRAEDGDIASIRSAQHELEALLVPLNRAAARRVLARLLREVARESGAGSVRPPTSPMSAPGAPAASQPQELNPMSESPENSAVDTAPDRVGAVDASATVMDATPLPARLPPPPRLGSIKDIPIGPLSSDEDEGEPSGSHGLAPSEEPVGADQTVQDGDVLSRHQADHAGVTRGSPKPWWVWASALLLLLAVLFFAVRLRAR
ncbi:MAG: hypothetical protein Q8Q09_26740 [Deltaproteobacteria bacterium]|nr:hypothetical protein [Deltaproteobacteria bacterium]